MATRKDTVDPCKDKSVATCRYKVELRHRVHAENNL